MGLFVKCNDETMIEYALKQLNISTDKVRKCMTYRYPAPSKTFSNDSRKYHLYSILGMVAFLSTLKKLKYLEKYIDDENVFINAVFHNDGWGDDAILCAIQSKKVDIVTYLLQNKNINKKCIDDQNKLWNIISNLIANWNKSMAQCIINQFKISEAKLKELKSFKDIDITKLLSVVN